MNLMLFILMCYGLTQILVIGAVFKSIRPKHYFFHCAMCMGFWVGILVFLGFWFSGIHLFPNLFIGVVGSGFISSGTSYALFSIFGDYGINVNTK